MAEPGRNRATWAKAEARRWLLAARAWRTLGPIQSEVQRQQYLACARYAAEYRRAALLTESKP